MAVAVSQGNDPAPGGARLTVSDAKGQPLPDGQVSLTLVTVVP